MLDADPGAIGDLQRSLEARGFAVLSARDGTSGLALLLDEVLALDALVVAVDLPDRDARSFAHLVRRAGGEQDLAIVAVAAGDVTARVRGELLALGTDDVVELGAGSDAIADAVLAAVGARSAKSSSTGERTTTPPIPCAA